VSFYLLLKQRAGGCDHSIACGTKCVELASSDFVDALDEAKEDYYIHEHLEDCETIKLLCVVNEWDLKEMLESQQEGAEDQTDEYIKELEGEVEQLKQQLDGSQRQYNLIRNTMKDLFGSDIVERAGMTGGLSEPFYGRPGLTVSDLCTKAIDARASKLVEPKMSAKKKMAQDFLDRLANARDARESAEIMADVTKVLTRIAK
jgi:hypothetical protein